MSEMTVSELVERMPGAFLPEKAVGVEATVQYHLTGADGGDWAITIAGGQCHVKKGIADSPKLTLTADAQDYKDMILGKLDGMAAFMQGKLKLAGDLNLAMKLMGFFKLK